MKILGIALAIVGVVVLAYGGFGYNRQKTIVDVGPIHATATEHRTVPISPLLGGLALAAGVALIVLPRSRSGA